MAEVEKLLDLAYRKYQENDLEASLNVYDEAIVAGGDKATINYYKGIVCEDRHKDDMAIEFYEEAVKYGEKFTDPLIRVYEIYSQLGKNEEALKVIDRMIEISPDLFFNYDLKFKFLFNLGNLEEANEVLEIIEGKFPPSDEITLDKVKLYTILGKFTEVLDIVESVDENSDIFNECLKEKGKIAAFEGDINRSLDILREVNRNNPLDIETIYLIGTFNILLGDFQEAKEYLEGLKSIRYSEDLSYFLGMYYYGAMLRVSNNEDVDDYFRKLLVRYVEYNTNNPNNLSLMVLRGICLYETQQYEKSLKLMDYALTICEDFAEVHYVKSLVYNKLDKHEEEEKERNLVTSSEPRLGMLLVVLEGMNEYINNVSE